jgi:hypothetical protein
MIIKAGFYLNNTVRKKFCISERVSVINVSANKIVSLFVVF